MKDQQPAEASVETFFDNNIRIEKIIWIAANADQPCDDLEDFFESEELPVINKLLGLKLKSNPRRHHGVEEILSDLCRRRLTGFLVQASTPIPTAFYKTGYATSGFGYYTSEWFYAEAVDGPLIQRILEWKKKFVAAAKKRDKKKKTS